MTISSRTPEGDPNVCPLCGHDFRLEPSRPPGDAPCPSCGNLVWFPGVMPKPTPLHVANFELTARSGNSSKVVGNEGISEKTAVPFKASDRVRVKEGYFEAFEGDVDAVDHANSRLTVVINIFGRATPVEFEDWQIELV